MTDDHKGGGSHELVGLVPRSRLPRCNRSQRQTRLTASRRHCGSRAPVDAAG
jgi:hypothetical protein